MDPPPYMESVGQNAGPSQYTHQPQPKPNHSVFKLEYYQQFFDLSTEVFLTRVFRALVPFGKLFYDDGKIISIPFGGGGETLDGLEPQSGDMTTSNNPFDDDMQQQPSMQVIQSSPPPQQQPERTLADYDPDLYGPFWIATTLIFVLAVVSNIVDYLQHKGDTVWHYDFQKVTIAATLFYILITIPPIIIWLIIRKFNVELTLPGIVCLFGYSLTPLVIACFLCALPVPYLNIASICLAYALTTLFLSRNIFVKFLQAVPPDSAEGTVQEEGIQSGARNKTIGLLIVLGIAVLQAGISIGCYFYFLRFKNTST